MQQLLNCCFDWSVDYGMSFAPEKCVVIAKDPIALLMGEERPGQIDTTKYLGIIFSYKGPVWDTCSSNMAQKAKGALMSLISHGFNKNSWCPSAKIDVYKLFIRPIMEYGMQTHLYNKNDIDKFEKIQQLALRIAYAVPWNTSKTAMKRLSCLESMECRNEILNARFIFRMINPPYEKTPASELFTHQLASKKGYAFEWKKDNKHVNYLLT
jgi:hypothetical protein